MATRETLGTDEQKLAELGYKQELTRGWSGFSNFAISFTIISVLAGPFTTFSQAWNNGGPPVITIGWPVITLSHPRRRFLDVRAGVRLPHRRRHLLLGLPARRGRLGLVHRLVQPARAGRDHGVGRLCLGDLPERAAWPVQPSLHRQLRHDQRLVEPPSHLRPVRADPADPRADQRLLLAAGCAVQPDLGLVACARRRRDRGHPRRRFRTTTRASPSAFTHRPQQLRIQLARCTGSTCCRWASC